MRLCVACLECGGAEVVLLESGSAGRLQVAGDVQSLDVPLDTSDESGHALFTILAARIRAAWGRIAPRPDRLIVVMPGAIIDGHILSAGRLGIRQPVDAARILSEHLSLEVQLAHDMDCLWRADRRQTDHETVSYVYVDEGIGGLTVINGVPSLGRGHAGVLGRLVMNPMGPFSPGLRARGVLEVYAARPAISENMVSQYRQQSPKSHSDVNSGTPFRRALATLSGIEHDPASLEYSLMAEGLADADPIAESVLEMAAQHLGLALSTLLTIVNPHRLVLAGSLVKDMPAVLDRTLHYLEQYTASKPLAETEIERWDTGRQRLFEGAATMAIEYDAVDWSGAR